MADIELVIKIPEELYNRFGYEYSEESLISKYTNDAILEAFCNGTPLPKGHGRLIDADAVYDDFEHGEYDFEAALEYAPTIIPAESEDKA